MMRGAAVMMILLSLSNAMFSASGYEFYGWCNKVTFADNHPLESATEAVLAILAAGLHRCADGSSDIYTMHGQAICRSSYRCAECLNDAKSYLLSGSGCRDHLGGQAHENAGYCSIRFENYVFCT